MKEGQRERKKKEGKNIQLVQNSDDEISSSDEERLDDHTKRGGKARIVGALENPKDAVRDFIPGEKGRKEREKRETEGDQPEVEGERSGV